jgi:ABC-2 type transport system permease protein
MAFAVATGAAAWVLAARRDLGAGLLAVRAGSAEGGKGLAGVGGLVWRRTQGSFLGWTVGAVAIGLAMGPAVSSMGGYIADNPMIAEVLGVGEGAPEEAMVEAFSGLLVLYMALVMGAYAILAMNSLRSDELTGLAALVLAGPVRRGRLLGATEATVAECAMLGMALAGTAYATAVAASKAVAVDVAFGVAGSALRAFPGLVATVALASFLGAALPRLTALSWVPFAYAFLHQILAPLLGWPEWTRYLSPLGALRLSPAQDVGAGALVGLLAVAAALFWAAHRRFRQRDLDA